MKALVALAAFAAALLGGAGALPLLLEARLTALAPGGLAFAGLHYNPLTGRLTLRSVRAHDEHGREIFRADEIDATAPLLDLIGGGPVALQRVRVVAPRLVLAQAPALTLASLGAAGLAAAPFLVDGIVVSDGAVVVEEPGRRALVARDLSARLDRAFGLGNRDAAFALETALYGTSVTLTGQPGGRGTYAVRVRARGLDAAALLEDFPHALAGAGVRLTEGRADVDATLVVAGSRVLASGQVRLQHVVARFVEPGSAPFVAAAIVIAVDRWDLAAGSGRISRLELQQPRLTLQPSTPAALTALVDWLAGPDVMLRRLRIVDGTVRLSGGAEPVMLRGLTLGLQAAGETGPRAGFVLTARAGVGASGRLALDGALSRDFSRAEGAVRAVGVTLDGCGLNDISMPLPTQASPRAVLEALASTCSP